MPHTLTDVALKQATVSVFEDTAFVFLDEEPDVPDYDGEIWHASITYQACEESGVLHLVLSEVLATEIAANLLSTEPDDIEAHLQAPSAAGEMVNILNGVVMEAMFEQDCRVDVGLPKLDRELFDADTALKKGALLALSLVSEDGERVDVALCPNNEV